MSPPSAADGAARQPWTDEAKFQLLLRIVAQLQEGGKSIDWNKIHMPGRTPKSLKNTWSNIRKAIADIEENEKAGGVATVSGSGSRSPAKPTTPRKRLPSKKKVTPFHEAQDDDDDDDDDDDKDAPKKATPMKRKAESTIDGDEKKLKCAIKHDPDDGDVKEDCLKHYYDEM